MARSVPGVMMVATTAAPCRWRKSSTLLSPAGGPGRSGTRRPLNRCASVPARDAELRLPQGWEQRTRLLYAALPNLEHDKEGHPEQAARVPAILEALERYGLRGEELATQDILELATPRMATPEEVAAVHIPAYTTELPNVCRSKGPGVLEGGGPTYFTEGSASAAFLSAGAGIQLVDGVVAASRARAAGDGAGAAGFGVCRPPGHHAIPAGPMGFCLFNNISVMARHAQSAHGLKNVMIFDFDVHHGNGTHDAFYKDPSVLFVSTHQAGGYPGTGLMTEVGEGDGEGYSINLPLPGDSGDSSMRAAFEEVVQPAAMRFKPDIILVSAGYDAHWRDPLAGLQFRTSTYHWLTRSIRDMADQLCEGRVVFMLEGGYDLRALGESVANSFLALLDKGPEDKFNPALLRDEPDEKVRSAILECKRIHEL
eukprot:jgi/Tetstr1/434603/TSEL_023694.t1